MFNYSKIRFFSKNGYQIPYDTTKTCFFNVDSSLNGQVEGKLYGIVSLDADGSVSKTINTFESVDKGVLFKKHNNIWDVSVAVISESLNPENKVNISINDCSLYEVEVNNDYITTDISTKCYGIKSVNTSISSYNVEFPSIKYNGLLEFKNVSTELFETETIYVLKEDVSNGIKTYEKLTSDDVENGRYELLFLIDSSDSSEFRIFNVDENSNDLIFNNTQNLKFTNNTETTGYRFNISFSAKEEGVYEEKLYICIIDKFHNDEPYLLGTIKLHGEAIGEDERYRTLFTNFGIPDPKNYLNIFKDSGTDEDLSNNKLLNEKSKELFLTYDKIFPYVGTYKALVNAIEYLGYNEITFKEWYKNTSVIEGKPEYVAYDVAYKNEYTKNKVNTLSIEERLSIKKLNWLTMKYKLNEEVKGSYDSSLDIKYSSEIPLIIKNEYSYRNDELLLKLYSLKQWLEKYIIAQNCRIIEIVGEGIYVERYAYNIYGNTVETYDYDSNIIMSPYLKGSSEDRMLKDGSAVISIGIKELDEFKSSIANRTVEDLQSVQVGNKENAELYIDLDSSSIKSIKNGYNEEKALKGRHILINDSFVHPKDFEYISIKASNSSSEYMFRSPIVDGSNNLWIHDGEILFEPKNYKNETIAKEVRFNKIPEIYVETAYLRDPNVEWVDNSTSIIYSIERDIDPSNNISFIIKNWRTGSQATATDYPILKPKNDAYLKYTEKNYLGLPLFLFKNFEMKNINPNIFTNSNEYVLDLKDGKFVFEDESEYFLYLNFNYDNIGKEQEIEVNTVYIADKIKINQTEFNQEFINNYVNNPDTAFNYLDHFDISVNKTGLYDVFVFCYDRYNNVYGKKVQGIPEVKMAAPEIIAIAEQNISNNDESFYIKNEDGIEVDKTELNKLYYNNPIFKPTYLINNVEVKDGSLYYKNISYAVDTPKETDIVRLYNITDRFNIDSNATSIPCDISRTGSAKSNAFYKTNNIGELVLFNTTYDNPIFSCDASINHTISDNKDLYKINSVSDSSFIDYFKNNIQPLHLYIRNKNSFDISIYNENNNTIFRIDKSKILGYLELPFKKYQKIKLITTDKNNNLLYNLGIYTINDISEDNNYIYIIVNVNINTEFFGNAVKYKITYPNEKFINYKVNVKSVEETISGDVVMSLDEDEMLDYIDNTYSIGYRDFDIKNAYNDWVKSFVFNNLYSFDIPITLQNDKIIFIAGESKYKIKNPSHYWIVYKQENGKQIKYYELYNDAIFLNIDEEGIYDVELRTYDEYGNLVGRNNKGSFKK